MVGAVSAVTAAETDPNREVPKRPEKSGPER